MTRKTLIVLAVLAGLFVSGSADAAQPSEKELAEKLDGPFEPPGWLAQTKTPFTDKELTATNRYGLTIWRRIFPFQGDQNKFREAVATMHRTIELNAKPEFKAACSLTLASYYEAMFDDAVRGHHWYRELSRLVKKVPAVHDSQNHLNRDTSRMAALGMARCCAMLGLKSRALATLKGHEFKDWRELIDLSIVHRMLGDLQAANAAVEKAIAAGSSGNIYAQLSSVGRGIILLYANGNDEGVAKHLGTYFKVHAQMVRRNRGRPLLIHYRGHHQRVLTIRRGRGKPRTVKLDKLADGTYAAESAGMHGPIRVSVTVKNAKLTGLEVVEHDEKRSFASTAAVPARMIARQSLVVDAVTAATVTSLAIEEAVRKALEKTQP